MGSLPREFVNPARLDSSDDTDEEEIEVSATAEPKFGIITKQPSTEAPLPSLDFLSEIHSKKDSSPPEIIGTINSSMPQSFSTGFNAQKNPPKTSTTLPQKSKSYDGSSTVKTAPTPKTTSTPQLEKSVEIPPKEEFTRSRETRSPGHSITRRSAISRKDKSKMEESRRRAKQMRDSRSPSSASGNEGTFGDRSSSCKEESTASPSPVHVPQIVLRRPTDPAVEPFTRLSAGDDNTFEELGKKLSKETISETPKENTAISNHSVPEFNKVGEKNGSLNYSTVEFGKSSSAAKKENDDLFTKVSTKKQPPVAEDIPKDFSVVPYSTVDFTKTKPVIKDTPDDFVKVKTGKSSSQAMSDSKHPRRMTTITEETSPPVPRRRREPPETATSLEASPKVPTRSASLKRKTTVDNDAPPPPPPSRVVPSISTESSSENSKPSTTPRTRPAVTPATPPVPRARARKPNDDTKTVPPLPPKESPSSSKPSLPPKESPSSLKPSLPPKESPLSSKPSLPPKADTPKMPPLPPKDDKPSSISEHLPSKNEPPKKEIPSLPKKEPPPLPEKESPPLPVKSSPPLPAKDNDYDNLSPVISRTGRARATISNKTVMGNLLEEIKKKRTESKFLPSEPEKKEEPTKIDPSKLSSSDTSSPERKKSPGNSPLRRRNATRSTRLDKGISNPTVGEDFPDSVDDFSQYRRRSTAMRSGRLKPVPSATMDAADTMSEMPRGRTRSSAVGVMQRPTRKGRPSDVKHLDEDFGRGQSDEIVSRPHSHSPAAAPDGEKITRL